VLSSVNGATMTSKSRGYSYQLVMDIRNADQALPGVRLGNLCTTKNIPVSEVAAACGVSRQTVYSWFTGRFTPTAKPLMTIYKLIDKYSAM